MWLTANWPFVVMLIALILVICLLIAYLFRTRAVGKAEVELGAGDFTFKLKLESNERQINEKDFNLVSLNEFYADSDIGFTIHKPLSKEWAIRKPVLQETYEEKGLTEEAIQDLMESVSGDITNPNENVHVLALTRGTVQTIRYTEETVVSGRQLELDTLKTLERGLRSCEERGYDQLSIYAFKRDAMKPGWGLLDFFLSGAQLYMALGPKRLHVNRDNTAFLIDCSALMQKIKYNGEVGDHIVNNVVLFQENIDYFFQVIIAYIQAADKPTKVWDELRTYLSSFRVLIR